MAGPLKTLYGALQASQYMAGVSFVYGDEEINTQRFQLPCVVMAPRGGPFQAPGYAFAVDPNTNMLWETQDTIDFWLWAASSDPTAQGAVDHADAVESLRQLFLSALQDQQAQYSDSASPAYGLYYKAVSGRWETVAQNPTSRYGRCYVVSVQLWIPIVMAPPTEVTVTTVTISAPA